MAAAELFLGPSALPVLAISCSRTLHVQLKAKQQHVAAVGAANANSPERKTRERCQETHHNAHHNLPQVRLRHVSDEHVRLPVLGKGNDDASLGAHSTASPPSLRL